MTLLPRVLRENPAFVRLWLAQVVSQAGDWLNRMAILALIGSLGGDEAATGVGLLFGLELALRLLPAAVLGPLAGPMADRLPRRAVLVAADLVRAVVVASMWFVRDVSDLPWLYALIAAQTAVSIVFEAARSAAVPDTVVRADLAAAHTLSAATWSVMLSVGAIAGGALVSAIGIHPVFLADAATYVVSALCLSGLRLPAVAKHAERFHWTDVVALRELRRGYRHARDAGVAPALWAKTFWGGAGGFLVLLSLMGREEGSTGSGEHAAGDAAFATGVLYAARGVGTGIGPYLAQHVFGTGDRALRVQIGWSFVVAALGYAAFGAADHLAFASLWVAIAHLGGATLWVASTVLWQRHVDSGFRGRVYAFETLWMNVAFAGGGLVAGGVFDATGSLRATAWTVAGLVLVLGIAWNVVAGRAPTRPS